MKYEKKKKKKKREENQSAIWRKLCTKQTTFIKSYGINSKNCMHATQREEAREKERDSERIELMLSQLLCLLRNIALMVVVSADIICNGNTTQ